MALGCPERTSDPDLGATFEDGDHHHVRDADTADEQGHATESQQQRSEGGVRKPASP